MHRSFFLSREASFTWDNKEAHALIQQWGVCYVSPIFHLCVPDNVPTTVQTQLDQKTEVVQTEWISLSGGTVPGPLGTEQTPRECVPPFA